VDDHEVARTLVLRTSRELLRVRGDARPDPRGGSATVVAAAGMLGALRRARPADALLHRQTRADRTRLDCDRVWIVDPLNGIEQYAEAGGIDWGVHVALWEHGRLSAGAVALPARGLLLGTAPTTAAGPPADGRGPAAGTIAARYGDGSQVAGEIAERLGARLVVRRSTGATIAAVLLGEADACLDPVGDDEWGSAGPVAVALAAGISASRLDGSPVTYNHADAVLPDLLVCRESVRPGLLAAVRGHRP
jgi:3'(2'), 5'-bisphosphate nucleotidase